MRNNAKMCQNHLNPLEFILSIITCLLSLYLPFREGVRSSPRHFFRLGGCLTNKTVRFGADSVVDRNKYCDFDPSPLAASVGSALLRPVTTGLGN